MLQQSSRCSNPRSGPQPHSEGAPGGIKVWSAGREMITGFQLDQGLIYLRVYFLDLLVCDGLSYHTRRQLTGCSWYLSTTTSTTSTITTSTRLGDTLFRVSTYQGMLRYITGNIKTFLLQVIHFYSQQYFRIHQFQLQTKSERYFQSTSVPALQWRQKVEGRKYFENFLFVVVVGF